MGACTSVQRPEDDILLTFSFLLDGVHKLLSRPIRNVRVTVRDFSAEEKCPKGWHVAPGVVFMILPVCRSDLALKKYGLRCVDRCSMEQRPGVVVMIFVWRWHLKVTGI